ncbi:MAG: LapA family protein [Bacteroidales bacterium]|nr:LapA family protein [Bacteroidales bacterium]
MQRSLITGLLLAILVIVFALQNSAPVPIKLGFWDINPSVALLVILVLFLGAILGILFSIPSIIKKKRIIEELKEKTGDIKKDA